MCCIKSYSSVAKIKIPTLVDNLNNVRCEASRHFRNKKKEYLKAKVEKLETNSKIKNIGDLYRSINDVKKSFASTFHISVPICIKY